MARCYIVCNWSWEKLTEDEFLGPFADIQEAEAVMPFALATHPREKPWPIWWWDDICDVFLGAQALRRIGALDDK
jgi:hypothetical protein